MAQYTMMVEFETESPDFGNLQGNVYNAIGASFPAVTCNSMVVLKKATKPHAPVLAPGIGSTRTSKWRELTNSFAFTFWVFHLTFGNVFRDLHIGALTTPEQCERVIDYWLERGIKYG